jgi:hypothetical protein
MRACVQEFVKMMERIESLAKHGDNDDDDDGLHQKQKCFLRVSVSGPRCVAHPQRGQKYNRCKCDSLFN